MAVEIQLKTFAWHVEQCALLGACNSTAVDKTDWIRIWALAREERGLPREANDWKRAFEGQQ